MKILVSGGAGYIGSHTVHLLRKLGHKVVVIDTLENGHRPSVPDDVPLHVCNIGDTEIVREILKNNQFDGVIHFAGYTEVGKSVIEPNSFFENNVVNGKKFLDVCLESKVKKFVFSSTAAVYGIPKTVPIPEDALKLPINPYGQSKLTFEYILESYAKAYQMSCVALRYFNAAGADFGVGEHHDPETHLIPIILQTALGKRESIKIFGTDYNTPDGTCIRDYIHVIDLAKAHILALEKCETGFHTYNLGIGKGYSVKEIVETSRQITGLDINAIESERRPGDPDQLIAKPDKAKKELEWETEFNLDDIIKSAWKWFSANPDGFKN